MADRLLSLVAVTKVYPSRDGQTPIRVLEGVDLELRAGELVCVAGRSGAGKTTLLNIAAGLVMPTSGVVLWGDVELDALGDAERSRLRRERLGLVFQDAGLIDRLTAAENVALPGLPAGLGRDARRRARELLEIVGVSNRANHFPSQLSGGERQRVGIARALFRDPPALLVDEPTANVDRATADAIIDLLVSLRAAGKGLLVASHDPHLIARADRVLALGG
ncbi:MAG TPA: ABC transporter ATP-binding protein [Candidatus Binatia bacterium]|nr:ABC transporter ATP-binding protein [Candidatus Binatia bacterium]